MTLEELRLLRERIQKMHDDAYYEARTCYAEDADYDWGKTAAYKNCLEEIDRFIPLGG